MREVSPDGKCIVVADSSIVYVGFSVLSSKPPVLMISHSYGRRVLAKDIRALSGPSTSLPTAASSLPVRAIVQFESGGCVMALRNIFYRQEVSNTPQ